jgi:predicted Zn-dependent peptidase
VKTDELVRYSLPNGLRVLLAPDPHVPVTGIAVHYNVGMRSEPPGRTGFAHLFEHLMFQGSESLPKLEHFRYVESSGGVFNGSTHMDYTQYYLVVPDYALERGLFLEADRMRAPDLNEDNLRLQVEVVKEEIRVNVRNKPYGGFPWLNLPAALFETFANRHDGYGSFEDLETATVDDATWFFDRYYAPANALLCVCGAFDPDEAVTLVERHFGDIAHRPAPPLPDVGEPDLTGERRVVHHDRHAPLPAVAAGWRVPDPVGSWADYLPFVLLAKIMAGGGASRLERRLVQRDGTVSQKSCQLGLLGDPFDVRDPTAFIVQARYSPQTSADDVLGAVDEEFRRVADEGLSRGELARGGSRITTALLQRANTVGGRTESLAKLELQHGRGELLGELPDLLRAVTEEQVRAAAATITPHRRAVVELRPDGADRKGPTP